MTAQALRGRSTPTPGVPVHMTLTAAQVDGLLALLNHVAPMIDDIIADDSARAAAERGLQRMRGAAQGLRPADSDQALERLGEALAGVVDHEAAGLLLARVRDVLDTARLWGAVERVHREAIRDDRPQADRLAALLRPELLTTRHWRLDALFLLRSLGESLALDH